MVKKRSPKEIIEAGENHSIEHAYVKFPGQEPIEISENSEGRRVCFDRERIKQLWENHGKKKYIQIHTHPSSAYAPDGYAYNSARYIANRVTPSGPDMAQFINNEKIKSMVVAQVDKDSGELQGYFYVRKTKNTPSCLNEGIILDSTREYDRLIDEDKTGDAIESFSKRYSLKYKIIPAKGFVKSTFRNYRGHYEFGGTFVKRPNSLEQKVSAVVAIGGILGSLFFLSSNVTGNAIADLSTKTTSFLGAGLLIVGLVAGFFWVKSRKK